MRIDGSSRQRAKRIVCRCGKYLAESMRGVECWKNGGVECWKNGGVECWSNGEME